MYRIFYALVVLIWIFDVTNLSIPAFAGFSGISSAFLDQTIAINGFAWFLIWCLLPSADAVYSHSKKGRN